MEDDPLIAINVSVELQGTDAFDAISKAFADMMAKKAFVVLPKGATLTALHPERSEEFSRKPKDPIDLPPVPPGLRKIDLDD